MAQSIDVVAQLPQLEQLCEAFITGADPQARANAEPVLRPFSLSIEYLGHLKLILDNSTNSYAQYFAASSMTKVITEHAVSSSTRLDMKNYFLSYLESRGPSLEPYVVTQVMLLLVRTVKLSWNDHDSHRTLHTDALRFLEQGTPGHYFLGLKLLTTLVQDLNTPTAGHTLTQHRKTAVSFRDLVLFNVFETALQALQALQSQTDQKLWEQGLMLALACLSYDFVGTCMDESSEDLGTIQVPSAWRSKIEDPTTLTLFLEYYRATKAPLSKTSLECLVRLASVRRSLFSSDADRAAFLNRLVNGTLDVLKTQKGLEQHENYHEFCRLLGRLKTNYQLCELVNVSSYPEWVGLVAQFTISSLESWRWASGSVFYLLGLWSRLVSSMPYLKGDAPSLLEKYVPMITKAYIESRLASVPAVMPNGASADPLEDCEHLEDQLEALPYLCRFQYDETGRYLISLLDPLLAAFSNPASEAALNVTEGQLAWLVYIVGAIIRGRISSPSSETQEVTDGDLAARVFGLLSAAKQHPLHAQRYTQPSRQRLDMALLSFFESFRKVYVGEQVMHASKVYQRLSEKLGLDDHLAVLSAILVQVATNLKVYGSCQEVINATLALFQDLATGYMSGKLLLKLDAITFILQHHTAEYYGFLDDPGNSRTRTSFYTTLAKLLFIEDQPAKFQAFVAPLQVKLMSMASAGAAAGGAVALRTPAAQRDVIGLFRDLRGIAAATMSKRTYGLVFDWLYPAHFPTLLAALEVWADSAEVTTPALKFLSEFVFNKSQRLTFEPSSANGILLFREVSKALVVFGRSVLSRPPSSDPYANKFKGVAICMQALTRSLGGNYVNFGVFQLYRDPALQDALEMALRMALSIPLSDILAYRKVASSYFALLEVLCLNHAGVLAAQDAPTFHFLVSSMDQGLKSLEVAISTQCASAVDNLCGYYFKHTSGPTASLSPTPPGVQAMTEHLRVAPSLFPDLLRTLFEVILFEDCSNQWSLSRPMLSLILLNEGVYSQIRGEVIASQPSDKRATLGQLLEKLMVGVQRNLEPKNRDKFTQNLTVTRHEFRAKQ